MDYQKAISNCRAMLSFLRADRGKQIKTRQINRIEEDTLKTAISAMEELEQYKALGTLEEVRDAMEKQKAKKPEYVNESEIRYTASYRCPNCGKNFSGTGIANHCYHCGQKLDWSVEE